MSDSGRPLDVLVSGMLFYDIVFTDLPSNPAPGTEVWAGGMGSGPGGIANLAVAAARLGLRTALSAGFGDDAYGRWCWDALSQSEGIDLTRSRMLNGWHSAVTASIAVGGDRTLVTHAHDFPVPPDVLMGDPPPSRAVLVDLGTCRATETPWWRTAASRGALVFADASWDSTGRWSRGDLDLLTDCHAFTPNAFEAMAYTRTSTPEEAVQSLAERVPLAVVTMGAEGAIAIDSAAGVTARVPALPVTALDPTGAGDVFDAGLAAGTLSGWPLGDRLAFAALCAGLAVQQFGGSLAAPGWGDVADWWARARREGDAELRARYAFLTDALPGGGLTRPRHADATLSSGLPEPIHGVGSRRQPRRRAPVARGTSPSRAALV